MRDFIPFIDSRLRIDWDESIGHGVYTSAFIKSGELLEIAPVIVIDKVHEDDNLFKYVVAWEDKLAIPLGWISLYNHSDDNFCEYSINVHDGLFAILAIKDIPANRQVTVNYGPNWFSSRGMDKVLL